MNFGVIAVTLSLELSIALACNASDTIASERQRGPYTRLAQASPDAAGATTNNLQGIGLTASHKQIIYDNIASEQAQTVSGDLRLAVGSTIPELAHAQFYADRGEGSDWSAIKGFQVRQGNGRQYSDRRSCQPQDRGHHHQARSRTIKQAFHTMVERAAKNDRVRRCLLRG